MRGFVAAFDLDSGKELWRTFMVPPPATQGSETWPKGDQWEDRRRALWVTGNYDPKPTSRLGTGNGGPWMGDQVRATTSTSHRPGLDVATGQIKGHFQYNRTIVGLGRSVTADCS